MVPKNWTSQVLGEVFDFKNGFNADKCEYGSGTKFINISEIFKSTSLYEKDIPGLVKVDEKQLELYLVEKGDVLFNRTSEVAKEIGMASVYLGNEEVIFGGFVIRGRPKTKDLIPEYCKYVFQTENVRKEIIRRGQGGIRTNIGQGDLNKVELIYPPKKEQKKIVSILTVWDNAILKLASLIKAKKDQKESLMLNLLSGKKRLGAFSGKWKEYSLDEFLTYTPREVNRPDEPYTAIGIRSHARGTFQRPIEDPSKIAMTKLFKPKENDLIVSITFAWEHAIAIAKKEDEIGFMSHRFPTYVTDECICYIDYLRQLILTKRFKHELMLISPGGAGRNRVMNKREFLKITVKLPPIEEQKGIKEFLNIADLEIQALDRKMNFFKVQRNGLMQQLLTGTKRV